MFFSIVAKCPCMSATAREAALAFSSLAPASIKASYSSSTIILQPRHPRQIHAELRLCIQRSHMNSHYMTFLRQQTEELFALFLVFAPFLSPLLYFCLRCARSFSFSLQNISKMSLSGTRSWGTLIVKGFVYISGSSKVISTSNSEAHPSGVFACEI